MSTIPIFIGVLLFLVVAHELGHFTIAKLSGIKVLEFGVGIPPKLFSFQRGETMYSVNLLPIGGFVRMLGEEDPEDERSFARKPALTRLAVLAAGPGVNAVLPIILLAIALMVPRDIAVTDVAVLTVIDDSPAAEAGVQPGDIVREADGRTVDNSSDLLGAVQRRLGSDMTWVVERQGSLIDISIADVRMDPPEGQGATGITLTDARVTVESVAPGSSAEAIGLRTGDRFLTIAASRILFDDAPSPAVALALEAEPTAPVEFRIMRRGTIEELIFDPSLAELTGLTVSVLPSVNRSRSLTQAVPDSFRQMRDILITFRNEISRLISGSSSLQLSGPIGIAQITGEVADAGLSPLIVWAALLSINLAIVNILPLPALDGGRIVFVLLELARGGRRLAPEKERMVHFVGFALLMSFIGIVSINDIQRLIAGTGPFD
jgi:regulator of sigma E protease